MKAHSGDMLADGRLTPDHFRCLPDVREAWAGDRQMPPAQPGHRFAPPRSCAQTAYSKRCVVYVNLSPALRAWTTFSQYAQYSFSCWAFRAIAFTRPAEAA